VLATGPTKNLPEKTVHTFRTAALVALLLLSDGVLARAADKPNILFCFADDWGRYASCYAALDAKPTANSVIKTPNIDTVAGRGVVFRNAFVPAPSCTPCRSSLLSGRYFFNTGRGAILNGAVWDETIPAFPLLLRDSGYDLGKMAKVWSPGTPADAPIGKQQYAYQKSGMGFNQFSEYVTTAVKNGKAVDQARAEMLAQVDGNFGSFLKARDPKKPFFFLFGPTNVHRKWLKGSGKALWGIDPDTLKEKLPKFLPDVPEVREDFADYLGEAQAFDAFIGVLLKQLKDAGELENTIVVISGDHGPPGFPGGKCNLYDFGTGVALTAAGPGVPGPRVVDDLVNLMDLAPTFLEIGGVKPPPGLNGKSVWPVLSSKKAGQVDPDRTWVVTGRERHVGDAREGNKPYPQRALRTAEFLYVRNFEPDRYPLGDPKGLTADSAPTVNELENNTYAAFPDMDAGPTKAWLISHRNDKEWKWHFDYAFAKRPVEELYDLKIDPDQVKNLVGERAYDATRKKLAYKLTKILTDTGDPRLVEKDCRFEKAPFTDFGPRKK
jgi:N-sulfoglucosamine sulfohydrolase